MGKSAFGGRARTLLRSSIRMSFPAELPPNGLPLPGTERYLLRMRLGQGGQGDAYLADDTALGRRVVIKTLRASLAVDASVKARFVSEARVTANIHNPSVVQVHDFGVLPDGDPYIIMEFVDGPSLLAYIRDRSPVRLSMALTLIAEVAEGLHAAHQLGVIHRDVKPENILVTSTGHAKLIDFGIAKGAMMEMTAGAGTKAGTVLGTPRYVSPEQAQARALTPASDLYSLGCVLYTTLTGRSVFEGTPLDMARHHVFTTAPTLADARCGVTFPPEVEAIVAKLLAKKPEDRFASGDELAKVLRRCAQTARQKEENDATEAFTPVEEGAPFVPAAPPTTGTVSSATSSSVSAVTPAATANKASAQTEVFERLDERSASAPVPAATPTTNVSTRTSSMPSSRPGRGWIVIAGVVGSLVVGAAIFFASRSTSPKTPTPTPPPTTVVSSTTPTLPHVVSPSTTTAATAIATAEPTTAEAPKSTTPPAPTAKPSATITKKSATTTPTATTPKTTTSKPTTGITDEAY